MAIITLNNNSLSSVTALPAGVGGKVLQVSSQVRNTSQQTIATTTYTDLTSLSIAITPSSTSSKILLKCFVHGVIDTTEGFGLQLKFLYHLLIHNSRYIMKLQNKYSNFEQTVFYNLF